MGKKNLTPQQSLTSRIAARQKFVKDIAEFIGQVIAKHGTVLSAKTFSAHTRTETEVNNFNQFSFYSTGSYTVAGGFVLKAWYHPGSERKIPPAVFEVEWWGEKKHTVKRFDSSEVWQGAMREIVRRKKTLIAQFGQAKIVEQTAQPAQPPDVQTIVQ